jgi:hypothetical protein
MQSITLHGHKNMAQQIDDIALAWDSLATGTDSSGWRTIHIASVGPCAIAAGVLFPGKEEALLTHFSSRLVAPSDKLPEAQGFSVTRVEPNNDGKAWLALTRKPTGSVELFVSMVTDVMRAMRADPHEEEAGLLRIFLGRIRAWQEFMRKGVQTLSPEAEIGLVGELCMLKSIINSGIPAAIALEDWIGPFDGIQDFIIGSGAIEVKATLSPLGFSAKIGSLEQLDTSTRQPLFLSGVRLQQVANGQSLPEFVEAFRKMIQGDAEAERLLSDRLLAAAYFDVHADKYPRRFDLASMRILEIDESFPRLTSGNVPVGVRRAMYEIDLDKVSGENYATEQVLKKLGAI